MWSTYTQSTATRSLRLHRNTRKVKFFCLRFGLLWTMSCVRVCVCLCVDVMSRDSLLTATPLRRPKYVPFHVCLAYAFGTTVIWRRRRIDTFGRWFFSSLFFLSVFLLSFVLSIRSSLFLQRFVHSWLLLPRSKCRWMMTMMMKFLHCFDMIRNDCADRKTVTYVCSTKSNWHRRHNNDMIRLNDMTIDVRARCSLICYWIILMLLLLL